MSYLNNFNNWSSSVNSDALLDLEEVKQKTQNQIADNVPTRFTAFSGTVSGSDPVNPSDFVNKQYLETQGFVKLDGSSQMTGDLKTTDVETTNYFSVNDQLAKIDNITSATQAPDITNFSGKITATDLAITNIYDKVSETTYLNFDGSDISATAVDLLLNGDSVVTETKSQNLTDKTLTDPNVSGYLQFADTAAPANPADNQGRLYKKTGDDGIFWKPDSAGPEVDLTTPINTTSDLSALTFIQNKVASPPSDINDAFIDIPTRTIYAATDAGISTFTYTANGIVSFASSLVIHTTCNRLKLSDDRSTAYVVRSNNQVEVVNVSNINSMSSITTLTAYTFSVYNLAVSGNNLYICTTGTDIIHYDISTPSAPATPTATTIGNVNAGVVASPDGALLITSDVGGSGKLLDISTPSTPVVLDSVLVFAAANGFDAEFNSTNTRLYTSNTQGLVQIFDITNTSDVIVLASLDIGSSSFGITYAENYGQKILYAAETTGLNIIDVSDDTITVIDDTVSSSSESTTTQVDLTNNLIFTAAKAAGIRSFDIARTVISPSGLYVNGITQSSSIDTGIVRIDGGVGIAKNLNVGGNIGASGYLQFDDVAAPANPANAQGRLYKKTGDDGLFWKPNSAGPEVDLTDTGISDHGALTGLADDDHTQYALLAGRAGGQTIIGGTAASENLTLNSTSNVSKGVIIANDPIRMATIVDSSNDEIVKFGNSGGTAVNEVTILSAATGGNPSIDATGDDANISFNIGAKGNGVINMTSNLAVNDVDSRIAATLLIGKATATKVEIADTGVITEVQGNLDALEGLDVTGNTTMSGYMQFADIAAPLNPANGQGRLYKKTGESGLFWKPDSGGAEVDLTTPTAGTPSFPLLAPFGSSSAPSYSFDTQTDTGVYFNSGSNSLSLVNSGYEISIPRTGVYSLTTTKGISVGDLSLFTASTTNSVITASNNTSNSSAACYRSSQANGNLTNHLVCTYDGTDVCTINNTGRILCTTPFNRTIDFPYVGLNTNATALYIREGNATQAVGLFEKYNGGLYISSSNTTTPSAFGVALLDGATSWTVASDRRLKKDIAECNDCLNKIATLTGYMYRFKKEADDAPMRLGLMADEVEAVFPLAVDTNDPMEEQLQYLDPADPDQKIKGLRYTELIAPIINAINELRVRIEALENSP